MASSPASKFLGFVVAFALSAWIAFGVQNAAWGESVGAKIVIFAVGNVLINLIWRAILQ